MAQPNSSFTELAAITIANYSKELSDNVSNNIPLLFYIDKKGNLKEDVSGGTTILENLDYGDNASFKWFSGYEELSVAPTDAFTAASFDWKECNANVIFSQREVAINSGEAKQFDLIKSKTLNTQRSIKNNLGAALYYSNTESDGKAIGGLQHLVADDPTTGIVGGINRGTAGNEFWRNQLYDFSVETVTASATTIQGAMATLYKRCSRNADVPDVIVLGDTYHSFWEASLQAQQQFHNTQDAGSGFVTQRYKKAVVLYDPNCSATRGYFLNSDFLKFKSHADVNMVVGEARLPTNQMATVIPVNWMGNLTTSNASLQGVMHA